MTKAETVQVEAYTAYTLPEGAVALVFDKSGSFILLSQSGLNAYTKAIDAGKSYRVAINAARKAGREES